jgi:hypothetical protein
MTDRLTNELLRTRRAVLGYLEQQQAQMGGFAPAHIVIEIEQTRSEIARLERHGGGRALQRPVLSDERPPRMAGAILLMSPEPIGDNQVVLEQAAFAAIDYHRGVLRQCWLIASAGEHGSLGAARWLAEYCVAREIAASVWQVSDPMSLAQTYNLAQWLYTVEVPASGLQPEEVIADITGATKPMTIGLLLASQMHGLVEYMVRQSPALSLPLLLQQVPAGAPPTDPRDQRGESSDQ